ncbi:MAG: aminopeptidase [Candidatus Hodarchaeota archaeon]
MSSEFDQYLEKYSELIVKVGLNLQPGQRLLIGAPRPSAYGVSIELAPLVRLIVKKSYQAGAKLVEVFWEDAQVRLIRYQFAPRDSFEEFPTWRTNAKFEISKNNDAMLLVAAENPDLLARQDSDLILTNRKSFYKHNKPSADLRRSGMGNWSVFAAPVKAWADKVFPDIPSTERMEKFWDVIFDICRVKEEDPISAWENHINQLVARSDFLNRKNYIALKYNAPGTDLTIGLPKGHIWKSANMTTKSGITHIGNLPTEEIYTTPHKDKVDGVITSTKPLALETCIDGLRLEFSKGKVVKASATKGEDYLKKLLKIDEGASRIGEVALVPNSSPISQLGILFYNTLIDENASCHIGLGNGIKACLKNGLDMSKEEFAAAGGNQCLFHIDFMVGSEKLHIYGIKEDGALESIMRKGEWAFEV